VVVSGVTVMISLAGLFFAGASLFSSFAIGMILAVATTVVGSLTFLPATLAALGDRVEKGRVPTAPAEGAADEGRAFTSNATEYSIRIGSSF